MSIMRSTEAPPGGGAQFLYSKKIYTSSSIWSSIEVRRTGPKSGVHGLALAAQELASDPHSVESRIGVAAEGYAFNPHRMVFSEQDTVGFRSGNASSPHRQPQRSSLKWPFNSDQRLSSVSTIRKVRPSFVRNSFVCSLGQLTICTGGRTRISRCNANQDLRARSNPCDQLAIGPNLLQASALKVVGATTSASCHGVWQERQFCNRHLLALAVEHGRRRTATTWS